MEFKSILALSFLVVLVSIYYDKRIYFTIFISLLFVSLFFVKNFPIVDPYFDTYRNFLFNRVFDNILILEILLVLLYLILYIPKDYIKIRDFIRNGSKVPVTYLNQEKKEKIIGKNLFCMKCHSKMTLDKEIYSKGMHMLYLKCKCGEEMKMRINEKV